MLRGEREKADLIVHADTTRERAATYAYIAMMEPLLRDGGIEVVTVRAKRAHLDLNQSKTSQGQYTMMPLFTRTEKGVRQLQRQCTKDWKINPVDKAIASFLKSHGLPRNTPRRVMIGITTGEWWRGKDSRHPHTTNVYPFLEEGVSRKDCEQWYADRGIEAPPKSSCVMCPYHNDRAWAEMKRENGEDWLRAIECDAAIRIRRNPDGSLNTPMYVHRACKPLADAVVLPEELPYEQESFVDIEYAQCDSGCCFL
jgi:hypothetical protein